MGKNKRMALAAVVIMLLGGCSAGNGTESRTETVSSLPESSIVNSSTQQEEIYRLDGDTLIIYSNEYFYTNNELLENPIDLTSIKKVIIEKGVTNINEGAFSAFTSLTEFSVSSENEYYSSSDGIIFNKEQTHLAFYPREKSDTSYTVPDSVTKIDRLAFYNCTALEDITISPSVTEIAEQAFTACANLKSVTMSDSVTVIGDGAFSVCENLTEITLPNSLTLIANGMFRYCGSLTSITIPDSVTAIENGAFSFCYGLTSITIPENVTTLSGSPFYDWTPNQTIYIKGKSAAPDTWNSKWNDGCHANIVWDT